MMNVAILGCGGIAKKMATTIMGTPETCGYAVAARDLDRAEAFRAKFGFQKAYGSYEEMLADPAIQLVYVAVPHSHHYKCVKMCLEAGKNVLCEKAFTVNANQARALISLATEKNLLLAEAIWTRYMPSRTMIRDVMESGIIGEPMGTMATLNYTIDHVPRLHQRELAGGALLDLGVYMLNYARMVFDEPIVKIISDIKQWGTGVDYLDSLSITFESGKTALVQSDCRCISPRRGDIFGTKGYIEIKNTNNPELIEVFDAGYNCIKSITPPPQLTGFEYELLACVRAIEAGNIECAEMPHSEIIYIMEWMDKLRAEYGYDIPEIV